MFEKKATPDLLDSVQFINRDGNKDPFETQNQEPEASDDVQQPTQNATPREMETMDTLYHTWSKKPSPEVMGRLLHKMEPTINSAMMTYAGGNNPVLRGKARKIAVDAIKSYKPNEKSTLKSWVSLNLQGLQRYASATTPMQAPERVRIDSSRIYKATQEFTSVHGRSPTDDELSELTMLSPKRIDYVRKTMIPVVTEGQFTGGHESDSEEESGIVPGIDNDEWQSIWAEYVYSDLDPINKKIFDMRMGRGEYKGQQLSVDQIARELKMSPAAVSQRTNKIADKLSEAFSYEGKI